MFTGLVDRLVDEFTRLDLDSVVGDACEGGNPSHDVCRLIIGATVERLARSGRRIDNYDFPLVGSPDAERAGGSGASIRVWLDDAAFQRKHEAARQYKELAAEFAMAIAGGKLNTFRVETLRPVSSREGFDGPPEQPPFYERFGKLKVSKGIYQQVVRYDEHVRPLAEALWTHATRVN